MGDSLVATVEQLASTTAYASCLQPGRWASAVEWLARGRAHCSSVGYQVRTTARETDFIQWIVEVGVAGWGGVGWWGEQPINNTHCRP